MAGVSIAIAMLAGIDNDRIREILPLLRLRSAEPTLFSQTVFYLLGIGLVLIVILYLTRRYRQHREQQNLFVHLGSELGLKPGQIEFLRLISRRLNLKNPRRLLSSASFFERHVGDHATDLAAKNLEHRDLPRITQIRQALGFDEIPLAQALTSTRQVEKGQTLLVWESHDHKEGFTPWILVDGDEASLTMSPLLREQDGETPSQFRIGDEVAIRFWRDGDTEYRFDTRIINLGAESALILRHTGEVERLQQRDFVRVNVHFPITLYQLEEPAEPEDGGPAEQAQTAVAMLDNDGTDDAADDASDTSEGGWEALDASVEAEASGTVNAQQPVDKSRPVHGQAVNISAGGMGVLFPERLPTDSQRWLVDPDFRGSFPLAAIVCTAVGEQRGKGTSTVVKLKFDELTSAAEKDIVRQVYEHQILEVGGIGTHAPPTPSPEQSEHDDFQSDD